MAGCVSDYVPTILDYLNEDCWRAVLDYVPTRDIIRTERASRRWQGVVLTYLRSVPIGIKDSRFCDYTILASEHRYVRQLKLRPVEIHLTSFERWMNKLGSAVVSACCRHNRLWKLIRDSCPNLEDITFFNLSDVFDENGGPKYLRRICFSYCSIPVDYCIRQLTCNNVLEELEINGSSRLTGQCLINTPWTHLHSLILKNCEVLQSRHLLAATCLGQLKSFELRKIRDIKIYEEIHLLMAKMPKLERLCVDGSGKNGSFFDSVRRLRYLKELEANFLCTDEDLEAVTRHCQELIILKLYSCRAVTGRGVAAVCRNAGARLSTLCLPACGRLMDDDALAIISSCPNLKVLNLGAGLFSTCASLSRAATARRALCVPSPMHLHVSVKDVGKYKHTEMEFHSPWLECAKCGV